MTEETVKEIIKDRISYLKINKIMEQLKFDFDSPKNNLTYIFENELQEKLFNKILLNHSWRNNSLYDNDFWKERLYNDILNIDNSNLQKIYDNLYKKCHQCNLQNYGWHINENKYALDYEIYRFDNDNYVHLKGLFQFINLIIKEQKCISYLEQNKLISYKVINNELYWIKENNNE